MNTYRKGFFMFNSMRSVIFNTILLVILLSCSKQDGTTPTPDLPANLKSLKLEHPRLFLTDEKLNQLKELRKTDAVLDKYINTVIATSNSLVTKPMLTRMLIGPRLLDVSRELPKRTTHLAMAYSFTADKYI